jgi:hypothetical protein
VDLRASFAKITLNRMKIAHPLTVVMGCNVLLLPQATGRVRVQGPSKRYKSFFLTCSRNTQTTHRIPDVALGSITGPPTAYASHFLSAIVLDSVLPSKHAVSGAPKAETVKEWTCAEVRSCFSVYEIN